METGSKISKENPFRVPEGYFEGLTDRTVSAVREGKKAESAVTADRSQKVSLRPFLALAAAITGFAVLTAGMVRLFSGPGGELPLQPVEGIYAELTTGDIDLYAIENELFPPENEFIIDRSVPDEAIINYLMLENIQLDDIYELL